MKIFLHEQFVSLYLYDKHVEKDCTAYRFTCECRWSFESSFNYTKELPEHLKNIPFRIEIDGVDYEPGNGVFCNVYAIIETTDEDDTDDKLFTYVHSDHIEVTALNLLEYEVEESVFDHTTPTLLRDNLKSFFLYSDESYIVEDESKYMYTKELSQEPIVLKLVYDAIMNNSNVLDDDIRNFPSIIFYEDAIYDDEILDYLVSLSDYIYHIRKEMTT